MSNLEHEISKLKFQGPASKRGAVRGRATLLAAFCLLLTVFCSLHGAGANGGAEGVVFEVGSAPKVSTPPGAPAELKVVSYNMRWRGGEDLRELIELLRTDAEIGGASVIGLQEVDRNKKRTDHTNTARAIAEALGMHYAWAAPPSKQGEEEETGVAILSPHELRDVSPLVLPHEGPGKRRRAAVGATVMFGQTPVRVYSVHAETRLPLAKKVEQWGAVLEDLKRHPQVSRAVVVGDFNTIKGKDVKAARKLFTDSGFATPFPDDLSTWRTFLFKLKLDWLWLRGFEAESFGIDKEVGLSDHWPLWVRIRMGGRAASPVAAAPRASPGPR
jgi:endonuclease/exonuclease/phosphatase family metal-dependent hydrolase